MTVQQMEERLKNSYPGDPVEVMDLTGTQNHYRVYVASQSFHGMTRVNRHKKIMDLFGPELKTGEVHALSIVAEVLETQGSDAKTQ